jgi:hypothetical protein
MSSEQVASVLRQSSMHGQYVKFIVARPVHNAALDIELVESSELKIATDTVKKETNTITKSKITSFNQAPITEKNKSVIVETEQIIDKKVNIQNLLDIEIENRLKNENHPHTDSEKKTEPNKEIEKQKLTIASSSSFEIQDSTKLLEFIKEQINRQTTPSSGADNNNNNPPLPVDASQLTDNKMNNKASSPPDNATANGKSDINNKLEPNETSTQTQTPVQTKFKENVNNSNFEKDYSSLLVADDEKKRRYELFSIELKCQSTGSSGTNVREATEPIPTSKLASTVTSVSLDNLNSQLYKFSIHVNIYEATSMATSFLPMASNSSNYDHTTTNTTTTTGAINENRVYFYIDKIINHSSSATTSNTITTTSDGEVNSIEIFDYLTHFDDLCINELYLKYEKIEKDLILPKTTPNIPPRPLTAKQKKEQFDCIVKKICDKLCDHLLNRYHKAKTTNVKYIRDTAFVQAMYKQKWNSILPKIVTTPEDVMSEDEDDEMDVENNDDDDNDDDNVDLDNDEENNDPECEEITEVIVALCDKRKSKSLGISLEGTVDIDEFGNETSPHHYIRSIMTNGPIDKIKQLALQPGGDGAYFKPGK